MRERDRPGAHVGFRFPHEETIKVVATTTVNRWQTRTPNCGDHRLPHVRFRSREDGLFPAYADLGLSFADHALRHGHGRHLKLCCSEMERVATPRNEFERRSIQIVV